MLVADPLDVRGRGAEKSVHRGTRSTSKPANEWHDIFLKTLWAGAERIKPFRGKEPGSSLSDPHSWNRVATEVRLVLGPDENDFQA
jgi:hypothetical protein